MCLVRLFLVDRAGPIIAQRRGMQSSAASIHSLVFLVVACSSSSTSGGGSHADAAAQGGSDGATTRCTTASDCVTYECVCDDNTTQLTATTCENSTCIDMSSECTTLCASAGGVKSVAPQPSAVGSAECVAWCNKANSLACAGAQPCDASFFCAVPVDGCVAATRAKLACDVQQGTWACNTGSEGAGFGVTSSCGTYTSLCSGDSGAP